MILRTPSIIHFKKYPVRWPYIHFRILPIRNARRYTTAIHWTGAKNSHTSLKFMVLLFDANKYLLAFVILVSEKHKFKEVCELFCSFLMNCNRIPPHVHMILIGKIRKWIYDQRAGYFKKMKQGIWINIERQFRIHSRFQVISIKKMREWIYV